MLEDEDSVTDLYLVSLVAFINVSKWKNLSGQIKNKNSGFVSYPSSHVQCEFHANNKVLTQVVCRHFNYQMGILRPVREIQAY